MVKRGEKLKKEIARRAAAAKEKGDSSPREVVLSAVLLFLVIGLIVYLVRSEPGSCAPTGAA